MINFSRKYFKNREVAKSFLPLFTNVVDKAAVNGVQKHGREEYLGILEAARLINLSVFSSIVDIASGDGVTQSAVWPILQEFPHCGGLCVEVDPGSFSNLATIYTRFPHVALARLKVTPMMVSELFSASEVPKTFDLLNLDIDSFDFPVLEAVLRDHWQPSILSMEINEKFPPSIYFCVNYDPEFAWDGGHFYGCSISAAAELLAEFDYEPIDLRGNNLIAVPRNRIPTGWEKRSISQLYNDGYLALRRRSGHFAWNANVDHWQNMPSQSLVGEIRKFFAQYSEDSYKLNAVN